MSYIIHYILILVFSLLGLKTSKSNSSSSLLKGYLDQEETPPSFKKDSLEWKNESIHFFDFKIKSNYEN